MNDQRREERKEGHGHNQRRDGQWPKDITQGEEKKDALPTH